MPVAYDPATVVLPSEVATRAIEGSLMFRRRTIWGVHIVALVIAGALFLWNALGSTALLTPASADFRAGLIGLGVFLGMLLAVVEREAWLLGIGVGRRPPPRGLGVPFGMLAIVAASGFGGEFVAERVWECWAFRTGPIAVADQGFTVTALHSSRSGRWIDLQAGPGEPVVSVNCASGTMSVLHRDDRLILPVETGRGGVRRVRLSPAAPLRRE